MNLIDQVLFMCDEVETPRSYLKWATYAAISAIVKKKIYVEKYFYRVYPNIYVMLVGPPGITKSYATDLAKQMVKSINNTRIISGMNSIEGIIQTLGKAELDADGVPKNKNSEAFIVSNEFTNLLIDNTQAFSILTELYDACYGDSWDKTLKSGVVNLRHPYITMITATNTAHFNDKLRQVDIEGGFMGRTMLILEKNRHKINSLIRKPERVFDINVIKSELLRISKLAGRIEFDNEVTIQFFDDFDREIKTQVKDDNTGIYKRMPDSVLKIAMLDVVASGNNLVITKKILERSIETCNGIIKNIKSVTAGVGSAPNSQAIFKFMQDLIGADENSIEHSEMLRKNYAHFDTFELGKIAETLSQAGAIEIRIAGGKKSYVLTDKALKTYYANKN